MKCVEKIFNGKKLVATIVRHNVKIKNLKFFTPPNDPIQVAMHSYLRKKNGRLQVYKISKPIQIFKISKFIYVESGTITVFLQTFSGKFISSVILKRGDSIIIKDIAHRIDFSANSRALEIKQGPYKGELIN